jgi:hypothetical protein
MLATGSACAGCVKSRRVTDQVLQVTRDCSHASSIVTMMSQTYGFRPHNKIYVPRGGGILNMTDFVDSTFNVITICDFVSMEKRVIVEVQP